MKAVLAGGAVALMLVSAASPAWAQSLKRAWVSGHGTDSASCGAPVTPCRSLQYVHDHVIAAGGEIDVLDPGGYGSIAITKALSIVNDGVGLAGVQQTAANQSAISVNAGPTDVITLRGLTITGGGTGGGGVSFAAGGGLTVRDSTIQGFAGDGITINSGAGSALIADTVISDLTEIGIDFEPTAAASLVAERVEITRCANIGILVEGASAPLSTVIKATISDSLFAANLRGIYIDGFSNTAQPTAIIINSVVTNTSSLGVVVSSSTASLAHSALAGNSTGYFIQAGGVLNSFGDNSILDTTHQGSLTLVAKQ